MTEWTGQNGACSTDQAANGREPGERLQVRVHVPEATVAKAAVPTLVYLPGLHGDWTLIGGFRKAVSGRVRFAELTYPRTLTWSLEDYAAAIEKGLAAVDITGGWLLAESFGSQLAWPLLARGRFQAQGLVLAGGFVTHPAQWMVRLARRMARGLPLRILTRTLFGYAIVARWRFRKEPEVLCGIHEFVARRTALDIRAANHRLDLIAESDPRVLARTVRVPIYAITGMLDPVVPWGPVRRWLRANCQALREYHIVRTADHNVLSTGAREAAEKILRWISDAHSTDTVKG